MSARDLYHNSLRRALEKDGWTITEDPLRLEIGGTKIKIDLGAERLLGAERGEEKIAVEIKSFIGDSFVTDLHLALGQCLVYLSVLKRQRPGQPLFLAITAGVYDYILQNDLAQAVLSDYPIRLVVFEPVLEEVVLWQV